MRGAAVILAVYALGMGAVAGFSNWPILLLPAILGALAVPVAVDLWRVDEDVRRARSGVPEPGSPPRDEQAALARRGPLEYRCETVELDNGTWRWAVDTYGARSGYWLSRETGVAETETEAMEAAALVVARYRESDERYAETRREWSA